MTTHPPYAPTAVPTNTPHTPCRYPPSFWARVSSNGYALVLVDERSARTKRLDFEQILSAIDFLLEDGRRGTDHERIRALERMKLALLATPRAAVSPS
jgi:hypothetical protein